MRYFLIEFNKSQGKLLLCEEFAEYRAAAAAQLRLDIAERGNPNLEIVVLGGRRREDLMRTHGRYFKNERQMVRELVGNVEKHLT